MTRSPSRATGPARSRSPSVFRERAGAAARAAARLWIPGAARQPAGPARRRQARERGRSPPARRRRGRRAPRRSAPRPGARAHRPLRLRARSRARPMAGTAAASTTACAANAQNAPRQWPAVANRPPINGPTSADTPQTPETSASNCGQACAGNSWAIPRCDSASIQPPPRPWSRRPSSIVAMPGASALAAHRSRRSGRRPTSPPASRGGSRRSRSRHPRRSSRASRARSPSK
jgi:hypothetical protein